MKRVLVVGPGPRRVGQRESGAAEAADAFARAGHEVVVADSTPTSPLLWSRHRRYLEPLDAPTLARICEVERIEAVCGADVAGVARIESPIAAPDAPRGDDLAEITRLLARGSPLAPAFVDVAREAPPGSVEIHVLVMTDARRARMLGTFEHVEHAPVHADDAAAVFPSLSAPETTLRAAEEESLRVAVASGARGIVTVRWALGSELVSLGVTGGVTTHALSLGLATGTDPVAEAARIALGEEVSTAPAPLPRHVAVEEHVFPFSETGATDTRLDRGPLSTGSVLALGETVERAYARALAAMGVSLQRPRGEAAVLLAGGDEHASALADVGRRLFALGFDVLATEEAARWLARVRVRHRVADDASSLVARRAVAAVVAATSREHPEARAELRRAALVAGVPCFTTIDLVRVAVRALEQDDGALHVRALDDWLA